MAAEQDGRPDEITFTMTNVRRGSVQVVLEPWGDEHDLAPGAILQVRASQWQGHPVDAAFQVELNEAGVTIYAESASLIRLFLDGQEV